MPSRCKIKTKQSSVRAKIPFHVLRCKSCSFCVCMWVSAKVVLCLWTLAPISSIYHECGTTLRKETASHWDFFPLCSSLPANNDHRAGWSGQMQCSSTCNPDLSACYATDIDTSIVILTQDNIEIGASDMVVDGQFYTLRYIVENKPVVVRSPGNGHWELFENVYVSEHSESLVCVHAMW